LIDGAKGVTHAVVQFLSFYFFLFIHALIIRLFSPFLQGKNKYKPHKNVSKIKV